MPPFLPRKRLRTPTPEAEAGPSKPSTKAKGKGKSVNTTPRKPTLFDDLDAGTGKTRSLEQSKAALAKIARDADEESSLSSLSEDEFEDVPNAMRQKTEEASDDEDEDIEFEDVQTHSAPGPSGPEPSGDLELTLRKDTRISLTNPLGTKKGPSKIERAIRIATHQMHVQMLMFHNAIRNAWLCDEQLQEILVKQLPPAVVRAVEKWRQDSGLVQNKEAIPKGMGKGEAKKVKGKKADARSRRDWGEPAERLEYGQVNMSGGDPIFRLLKLLIQYWKQRFRITAPGLRKLAYMSLERLDEETKSFNKDQHDPERHGERIRDICDFREHAKALEGSRDVGAQFFTSLLRGLGIEARMVANLQPVGFGWSQNEEASEKNPRKLKEKKPLADEDSSEEEDDKEEEEEKPLAKSKGKGKAISKTTKPAKKPANPKPRRSGIQSEPTDLSDSELSDLLSEEDDDSVIDITPAKQRAQPSKPYDKDLLFPHYWTEVLSPVTKTYTAVDPAVLHIVATKPELVGKFEPRGAKADKAKQVASYIVGHSPDGTAKDVTTRYLKRHVWPGRTKGNRIPVEKVPIHNSKGKIKRYEEYDWFKTVMSGYVRGTQKYPRTEIDDQEDATDLKVVKPEKKEVEEGKETLQSYKSSPDFVLGRHLKREEALLPTARHVKMFTVKGKDQETTEEKVYRRKDVVSCKTMETWHKEGRAPNKGEQPLKRVPYRAATTNRRRELAEAEQATGEKMLQGLYSWDQTDWIIPQPIENGIIPKNNFGNIDLYVDSMLPEGAAHIPRRGTVKICKRLGIDYAEAVVGFEFGHRMAVPIINGVVVAIESYEMVMEEWGKDEAERLRKEDEKRTKTAIHMWRKMLMGMRIIERLREEYGGDFGDETDVLNPWTNKKGKEVDKDLEAQRRTMDKRDEDMAGGFLPEGHDEEEVEPRHLESFFPIAHEEDDEGGGFVIEGHDEVPTALTAHSKSTNGQAYPTPQSLYSISKVEPSLVSGEDDEDDAESEIEEVPSSEKRSRPSGSAKKSSKANSPTATTTEAKTNPKHCTMHKKAAAPKSTRKRKRQIADSETGEGDDEEGTEDLAYEVDRRPKKASKRGGGRRAAMPAKTTQSSRQMPKRNAARKSKSALKSPYFEHSDGDGD